MRRISPTDALGGFAGAPSNGRFSRIVDHPATLARLALASVIANVGIVITGGAVRLTGSGLGCPTVPRCTDTSYTPSAEMGIHGAIEFGNRMLTFVLGAIAVLGVLAALRSRPRRRRAVLLSLLVLATIPAQALVGMVTVWTELNPWVVGSHFLFSMAVIAAAYAFWRATREPDGEVTPLVPRPIRQLGVLLLLSALATLALGTLVTGAGPHAGDENAKRNGLDLANITQLHADSVFLLVGLSIATWFALRAVAAPRPAMRAASALLLIELSQGAVGFIQYATNLPELAVGLHMAGACAVWLAVLAFWYASRTRASGQPAAGGAEAAAPVEALARA